MIATGWYGGRDATALITSFIIEHSTLFLGGTVTTDDGNMDAHVLAGYFVDCRIFIEISVVFYSVNFSLKCSVFPHQNLCFLCFCSDSFHIENIQSRGETMCKECLHI